MQFQLVTPERVFFSGLITQVQIPGIEGDMGVLPGHAPTITTLRPGIVTIDTEAGEQMKIAVVEGIAEITGERCTVLAEEARNLSGIARDVLAAEIQQAEKVERDSINEKEIATAQKAKQMAETLLQAL